ncbi:hypothetical protein BFJ63_vAg17148 [Fusarium oxysporum f. sp. narcissi]|uniref:Uncharacterized protein n=1 Tax=Fusarium oxysporum f. sp. narcissi TaxID=451672 RepID=A0A4Q2V0F7_FUSOX|nr:hypothetical protein BFJ63_vAg17148 [Fusarium oxysporum f. sp. narcissi]
MKKRNHGSRALRSLLGGVWLEEYRGRHYTKQASVSASFCPTLPAPVRKEKAFVAVKSHKRLKLRHEALATDPPAVDLLDQFLETDVMRLGEDETFDAIRYWNDRYYTQPDLARMALDALAVLRVRAAIQQRQDAAFRPAVEA